MAKCPACLRKVSLRELFRQVGFGRYRCTRCGRSWYFSPATVAISLTVASCGALALAFGYVFEIRENLVAWAASLVVFCLLFSICLLLIGRLEPIPARKSRRES